MDQKTLRTRIRCRYWLMAFAIACATLSIGTYINARYVGYAVSLQQDDSDPQPAPPKTEKEWEQGGGKV